MDDLMDGAARAAFLGFLLDAKRATYAGQGDDTTVVAYAGGVVPSARESSEARAIYAFLRRALQRGTSQHPYRGPALFSDESFTYTNETAGELDAFSGLEQITRSSETVYELRYAGGFLG